MEGFINFPADGVDLVGWPKLPSADTIITMDEFVRLYLEAKGTNEEIQIERVSARLQGFEDHSYHALMLRYVLYLRGVEAPE
jgi:hypothetical protein